MKYIKKGQEPPEFSVWKKKNKNAQYKDLCGHPKSALKEALMKEQGFICCYCERELSKDDSHIEHIEPRSLAPKRDLDFMNMLCSCQKKLAKGGLRHCGNSKDDWFDVAYFISPLMPDSEEHFAFDMQGLVKPRDKNDLAAQNTIEVLKLNLGKLRNMRKKALNPFLDPKISEEDYVNFINNYLLPTPDGKFTPFWSVIKDVCHGVKNERE